MTSAWDTAAELPLRPPGDLDDGDLVVTPDGTYWECGFTDWHLMLGWFAGPETLRRYPDDRVQHWTVVETDASGQRRVAQHPFGADDRRELDDEINEQLRERGLPPRPAGYRWFQLVPPGGTGRDVVAAYVQTQGELPFRDVALETAYARAAVELLYGRPVTPLPPIPEHEPEPRDEPDRTAPSCTCRRPPPARRARACFGSPTPARSGTASTDCPLSGRSRTTGPSC